MNKNEVKYGALLSYIIIICNALYGLVIAPYLLSTVGTSEYGVYKTIGALTSSISVLELGIGGTMQRYVAKFNALKEKEKCFNFSAMGLLQAVVLSFAMMIVGIVMYFALDSIYSNTFSVSEMNRAKQIMVVQIIYVMLHIFENLLFGIISGYNRFIFINSIKITALIFKVLLYFIVLPIYKNSLTVVVISLVIEITTILIEIIYLKKVLKHRIHLYFWDIPLFKESFLYTILLFVQSIIIQFNGNIDNIVIGAVIGTSAVTVYSFAIQIFNMYETCATSISGVVLPTVTEQVYSGATTSELEKTVEKFGRIQWIFLGAVLTGFICCGKEFFILWLGSEYLDCWYLALILMIPVSFPLIVNVCLAILKAKNMLKFRTLSLAYSAVVNALFTIIGTHIWGYWAAAIGTAMYTIIGSIISLNIYYKVKLGINILKLYAKIMGKTTLCLVCAGAVCLVLNNYLYGSWFALCAKICVFLLIYAVLIFTFALNDSEKQIFKFRKNRGEK